MTDNNGIKQTGNYALIGETARGNFYTCYESGGGSVFVGTSTGLSEQPSVPKDATREVEIYLGHKGSEAVVGKLNVLKMSADGTRETDDTAKAAIIGGRLFVIGEPIGGAMVETTTYERAKPVLAKAAEHLSVASFTSVSFTDRAAPAHPAPLAKATNG